MSSCNSQIFVNDNCISMCRQISPIIWCRPCETYKCCNSIENERIIQVSVAVGDYSIAQNIIDNYINNGPTCCPDMLPEPGNGGGIRNIERTKGEKKNLSKTYKLDMDEKDINIQINKDGEVYVNGNNLGEE